MSAEHESVVKALGKLAKLMNREIPGDAIVFFADVVLKRLTPQEALHGIHDWAMLSAKFPTPAELIKCVRGEAITARDEATEVASALLMTIRRRGYTWNTLFRYDYPTLEAAITAECGHVGWLVVQRMGGWKPLCEQFSEDDHASARLRDIAEIAIKAVKRGEANLLGAASGPDPMIANGLEDYIKRQKALQAKRAETPHEPVIDDDQLPF